MSSEIKPNNNIYNGCLSEWIVIGESVGLWFTIFIFLFTSVTFIRKRHDRTTSENIQKQYFIYYCLFICLFTFWKIVCYCVFFVDSKYVFKMLFIIMEITFYMPCCLCTFDWMTLYCLINDWSFMSESIFSVKNWMGTKICIKIFFILFKRLKINLIFNNFLEYFINISWKANYYFSLSLKVHHKNYFFSKQTLKKSLLPFPCQLEKSALKPWNSVS